MEERLAKRKGFAEMAKLISSIREKSISTFVANWKQLIDFLHEIEKSEFIT